MDANVIWESWEMFFTCFDLFAEMFEQLSFGGWWLAARPSQLSQDVFCRELVGPLLLQLSFLVELNQLWSGPAAAAALVRRQPWCYSVMTSFVLRLSWRRRRPEVVVVDAVDDAMVDHVVVVVEVIHKVFVFFFDDVSHRLFGIQPAKSIKLLIALKKFVTEIFPLHFYWPKKLNTQCPSTNAMKYVMQ